MKPKENPKIKELDPGGRLRQMYRDGEWCPYNCGLHSHAAADFSHFVAHVHRHEAKASQTQAIVTEQRALRPGERALKDHPAHVKPLHDGERHMGRRWAPGPPRVTI